MRADRSLTSSRAAIASMPSSLPEIISSSHPRPLATLASLTPNFRSRSCYCQERRQAFLAFDVSFRTVMILALGALVRARNAARRSRSMPCADAD
jgi:hypothetical protein